LAVVDILRMGQPSTDEGQVAAVRPLLF